tara:strand:+ start:2276 stop:3259 length:984 start_codon:yes stop_codon:yes gene_type:complete
MPMSEEAKQNPMVKPEIPRVMMGRGGYLTNEERIKKDEAELEEMKKEARAAAGIPEPDESETTEDQPSSEEPEAEPVQAESDTKQEEKPESKAQEEDDLSAEEKTFKQRYGELRRHQQEQKKQFDSKIESLQAQLDKAAKNELVLPKTDEELEAWTKEYPDVAAIIETIADKKARSATQELDTKMAEFEELRYTAKREKAEAELINMHPDFIEIREDDKFHNWAKEQPKWVQDALYENQDDAKSVSRVLDLYKTDMGITNKKASSPDKAAASSVKTKSAVKAEPDESAKYIRESDVAAMSIKEYEKRQEEILDAQRKGNFIYDMSRK